MRSSHRVVPELAYVWPPEATVHREDSGRPCRSRRRRPPGAKFRRVRTQDCLASQKLSVDLLDNHLCLTFSEDSRSWYVNTVDIAKRKDSGDSGLKRVFIGRNAAILGHSGFEHDCRSDVQRNRQNQTCIQTATIREAFGTTAIFSPADPGSANEGDTSRVEFGKNCRPKVARKPVKVMALAKSA